MISVQSITKRYGDRVVLDQVSFSVRKGEMLGLLGPNGAGKTTTMRIITGFMPPTSGQVLIDGKDIFDHPHELKGRIGYLPEQPPLYADMTVAECLSFVAEIQGLRGAAEEEALERVAGLCGITDVMGRLTGNLSKGYRQRVGLAQALVHDPDVLVLDEPTAGLDPRQIIEIRQLIKRLGEERVVVISSHILSEVTNVCRQVAIIDQGRIVAVDSLDALSHRLDGVRTIVLRVRRPDRIDTDRLRALPGSVSAVAGDGDTVVVRISGGDDGVEALARYCVESGAGLIELKEQTMSLEDIFLKVLAGERVT